MELWRKTGQRGLLTTSYKRVGKYWDKAVCDPAHFVLHHLHTQLSRRQSCHRKKKSCVYVHRVTSVMSNSLLPCRLWPTRLLCQGTGFSRQEYWSVLANTGCHTLLEHYISYCPSCQPPLSTWCCQNPCDPKQLHHFHTWPAQGQTQALRGSPRS